MRAKSDALAASIRRSVARIAFSAHPSSSSWACGCVGQGSGVNVSWMTGGLTAIAEREESGDHLARREVRAGALVARERRGPDLRDAIRLPIVVELRAD